MPATPDGLCKAQGCLWYSLANWEDEMQRPNRNCGPWDNVQPRRSRDVQQTVLLHFSRNRPACCSWIALVKPIHVHLFNSLVIFVPINVTIKTNAYIYFKRLFSFRNSCRLIECSWPKTTRAFTSRSPFFFFNQKANYIWIFWTWTTPFTNKRRKTAKRHHNTVSSELLKRMMVPFF